MSWFALMVTMAMVLQSAGGPTLFRGKAHVIPGTIEAEDFDEGGEGVAYHDRDPENQEKKRPAYRQGGVDLEWRAAASQEYNLGWTRAGEWLIYTVDVRESGTYRVEMLVASAKPGGALRPVPTAVPPSASSARRGFAAASRAKPLRAWRA